MRCSLNVLQERWKGGCWSAKRYDDDDMSAKRSSSPHLHDLDDRQRMLVSCEVWCWHVSQVSSYPEPPGSRMFILLLHLRCLGWALLCHLCVKLPLLSNAFIRLKSPKLYRIENLAQNSTGYKYKWEEPTQLSWTGVCSGELQIWLSHVVLQIVNHMSLGCQHQRSPSHLNTQST